MTATGQKPCSQPAAETIATAPMIPATVTATITAPTVPEAWRRAQSPGNPVTTHTAKATIPASKTLIASIS